MKYDYAMFVALLAVIISGPMIWYFSQDPNPPYPGEPAEEGKITVTEHNDGGMMIHNRTSKPCKVAIGDNVVYAMSTDEIVAEYVDEIPVEKPIGAILPAFRMKDGTLNTDTNLCLYLYADGGVKWGRLTR